MTVARQTGRGRVTRETERKRVREKETETADQPETVDISVLLQKQDIVFGGDGMVTFDLGQ